jgi:hypothetical protein
MSGAVRSNSERPAWWRIRAPGFALRYGLATAVGVVLTLAVHEWQPAGRSAYNDLAGTMVPGSSRAETRMLERVRTQVDEVTAVVELRQDDRQLLLDIHVDAAEAVELAIDFTASGLRPVGIAQPRFPFESIEIADPVLRARASGRQHVSVSLRRVEEAVAGEPRIRLEYSSGGRVLKQGSLSSTVE